MPQRLTLREIQLAELDILLKVTQYFDSQGIYYILCSGTMLGAVRHKGFIPWDDDIDIYIFRKDFERLKTLAPDDREIPGGIKFRVPGDEEYVYPFIKAVNPSIRADDGRIIGDSYLWADIFPLDNFPDDTREHKKYIRKARFLQAVLLLATYSREHLKERGYTRTLKGKIRVLAAKIIYTLMGGYKHIAMRLDRMARELDSKYTSSHHVGDGAWPNGMNDYFHVDWVKSAIKCEFEGHEFNIPAKYDDCLTQFFGDYMTPPPEDKRQTHYLKAYRQ